MPGGGTGTFIDPDDYRASLRQARIDLLDTLQGGFKARLIWATPHCLQLLHSDVHPDSEFSAELLPTLHSQPKN